MNKKFTKEEYQKLMVEIDNVRQKVADFELWKTMHALTDVLDTAGWEVAEKLNYLRKK